MPLDYETESVMMEFKAAADKKPSLEDVRQTFELKEDEVDDNFGVYTMEREEGDTYISVVSKKAGERVEKDKHPDFIMNWSNPKFRHCSK